ncbi:MAG: hypothetical protein NXI14_13420 [bacterium]|nr:hypothetical protein [bacterium]
MNQRTYQWIGCGLLGLVVGIVLTRLAAMPSENERQAQGIMKDLIAGQLDRGDLIFAGEIPVELQLEIMAATLGSMRLYENDDLLIGTTFTDSEVEAAYRLVESLVAEGRALPVWLKPALTFDDYYYFEAKLNKLGDLEFHGYLVDVESQIVVPVENPSGLMLTPMR